MFGNCQEIGKFLTASKRCSNLENAFETILEKLFVKSIWSKSFVMPETLNDYTLTDFKESYLINQLKNSTSVFRQETTLKPLNRYQRRYLVILVASFDQFVEVFIKIFPKGEPIFKPNAHVIIVLGHGEIKRIEEIFELMWKRQTYNVVVMYEADNGTVYFKTFIPFSAGNCENTTPIIINEFRDGRMLNGLGNIFPKKMRNLHNCPIRLSVSSNSEPYVFARFSGGGTYSLSGPDIETIQALSKYIHFKINYTFIGPNDYFTDNGTAKGPLKTLRDGDADLSISGFWLKSNRMKFFDFTTSYYHDHLLFVIPPGQEFSMFEKLVFPFSVPVWFLFLLYVFVGLLVILFANRRSRRIRDFLLGTGVRHPYMNLFISLVGETQNVLPKRNFARFLLMVFLLYSLVMRTVYQGKFYQLLRSSKHHKEVQSIDEMVQKDFKFYVYSEHADMYSGTEAIKKRFFELNFDFL